MTKPLHASLEISTGCRIHFGLTEVHPGAPNCYSGLGLMLSSPGIRLRFRPDASTSSSPYSASYTDDFLGRIEAARETFRLCCPNAPATERVECLESLPSHSGLGSGTQLAAAAAAGFYLSSLRSDQSYEPSWQPLRNVLNQRHDARWLARMTGRGMRSAIGLAGFLDGGLLFDHGNSSSQPDRQFQVQHFAIPAAWRVVLIRPRAARPSVSGSIEASLIQQIAARENPHRPEMLILAAEIVKQFCDFDRFATQLEAYLLLAGQLFQEAQGGLFNGVDVERAAQCAQNTSLRAIGQSSWGPTVFGFARNQAEAGECASELQASLGEESYAVTVCEPARTGAQFRWLPGEALEA